MHKWIGKRYLHCLEILLKIPAHCQSTRFPQNPIIWAKPYYLDKTLLFRQFFLSNIVMWFAGVRVFICTRFVLLHTSFFWNISKTFPRLDFAPVDVGIFFLPWWWSLCGKPLSHFLKKLKNIFSDLVSSEYIAIPCLSNELPNHLFQVTQMYFVTVFDNPVPQRPLNIR